MLQHTQHHWLTSDDSWKLIAITASSQADGDEFDPEGGGGERHQNSLFIWFVPFVHKRFH